MTEIHAALGLASMGYWEKLLEEKRLIRHKYENALRSSELKLQRINEGSNCSYMSVEFQTELKLLEAIERLEKIEVMPRDILDHHWMRQIYTMVEVRQKNREKYQKEFCVYESLRNKRLGVIKIADAIKD